MPLIEGLKKTFKHTVYATPIGDNNQNMKQVI